GCRGLKLPGPLRLVLHDGGACRNLVSMTDVSDPESDEIASAKPAPHCPTLSGHLLRIRGCIEVETPRVGAPIIKFSPPTLQVCHFVMPRGPVTFTATSDVFSNSIVPNFSFDSCWR